MSPTLYQEEEEEEVEEEEWLRLTYLVTLPLCTGVSRMVWVSRTISPEQKFFLLSSVDRLFPSIVERFRINFY